MSLGGGPGFAVGAIAGLASNFFFGQGPWTPWQMAAWGATGVLGAGLARTGLLRDSRWRLAIVCCAVGFAFTAFQDVGDWVTFSDHSRAQLGRLRRPGARLRRDPRRRLPGVRARLRAGADPIDPTLRAAPGGDVAPPPRHSPCGLIVFAAAGAASMPSRAQAASSPASYLIGAQNADGGFGMSTGQRSDQLYAGWAALGLASAGYDLNRVAHGGPSVIDYVRAGAGATDPGSLERTILVARAAGQSARSFGGHDLIAALEHHVSANGSVSGQVNLTAFAALAMRADGVAPPSRTLGWLARQQDSDGGFSFSGAGGSSDPDDTGATLEALAGAGGRAPVVRSRAVVYLRRQQDGDGGFASEPGGGSNAQSTAWAIQGLEASGVSPDGLHRRGARSPVAYLQSLIGPQRRSRLCARQSPDAGVGHRGGADGARGQAVAARRPAGGPYGTRADRPALGHVHDVHHVGDHLRFRQPHGPTGPPSTLAASPRGGRPATLRAPPRRPRRPHRRGAGRRRWACSPRLSWRPSTPAESDDGTRACRNLYAAPPHADRSCEGDG